LYSAPRQCETSHAWPRTDKNARWLLSKPPWTRQNSKPAKAPAKTHPTKRTPYQTWKASVQTQRPTGSKRLLQPYNQNEKEEFKCLERPFLKKQTAFCFAKTRKNILTKKQGASRARPLAIANHLNDWSRTNSQPFKIKRTLIIRSFFKSLLDLANFSGVWALLKPVFGLIYPVFLIVIDAGGYLLLAYVARL